MTWRRRAFIAWGHLKSRPFQLVSVMLVVALATGMGAFMYLFSGGLQRGLIGATEPFELLVGARSGAWQLAMHTVLLQDQPAGNVSFDLVEELKADERTRLVVPLAFGDYVKGFPLVGASENVTEIRVSPQSPPWLQLAQGRLFAQPFEVVAGAEAARLLNLNIGDSLQSVHGLEEKTHEETYRVTGIAAPVRGPYDRALFTSLESFWHSHGGGECSGDSGCADHDHDDGCDGHHDHHDESHHDHKKEVTTLLVYPSSYQAAYSLASSFQNRQDCQLIFPAQRLIHFFSLMGRGQKTLEAVALVTLAAALLLTVLVLCGAGAGRSREQTLLRVLGATRQDLMAIAWLEGLICVTFGSVFGWIGARLILWGVFHSMSNTTALHLSMPWSVNEIFFFLVALACGALSGLVPALLNNRRTLEDLLSQR